MHSLTYCIAILSWMTNLAQTKAVFAHYLVGDEIPFVEKYNTNLPQVYPATQAHAEQDVSDALAMGFVSLRAEVRHV